MMLEEYIPNAYVRAGFIFLVVFIVVRIWMFTLTKVLPVLTRKTETSLDDELLERASMPLTLLALLAGFRIAFEEASVEAGLNLIVNEVVTTLMIIVGAILVYHVLDALVSVGYRDFGKRVHRRVNESLLQFFHSMLMIVVVVAAFLIILSSWGVEIGPLLAGLGVAGIAIAFALQSTLANVFGGISMLLDKSINVGDLLEMSDGTVGYISKINLRSTKIRTLNNKLVIVPNGKLSESNIKNVALPTPETRVVIPFSVAYGTDVERVRRVVLREIRKVEGFYDKKDPVVRLMEMGESSLNFKAYFYIKSFTRLRTATDDANTRIYDALNKARISIPFPQLDVHLKRR